MASDWIETVEHASDGESESDSLADDLVAWDRDGVDADAVFGLDATPERDEAVDPGSTALGEEYAQVSEDLLEWTPTADEPEPAPPQQDVTELDGGPARLEWEPGSPPDGGDDVPLPEGREDAPLPEGHEDGPLPGGQILGQDQAFDRCGPAGARR